MLGLVTAKAYRHGSGDIYTVQARKNYSEQQFTNKVRNGRFQQFSKIEK